MESQLASLKDLTSKGPMTIRAMALAGGCAMVAQVSLTRKNTPAKGEERLLCSHMCCPFVHTCVWAVLHG